MKKEIKKELTNMFLFLVVISVAYWYRDLPWWRFPLNIVLLMTLTNRIKWK